MERAFFHDVRGVLGAAASNVEFLRARESGERASVLAEIANELRLASDAIALAGSADDQRVLEVDARALFFVARGGRAFAIDGTQPPFVMKGARGALLAFATLAVDSALRGAAVDVSVRGCTVRGLETAALERVAAAAMSADRSLSAVTEGGVLVLCRKTEQELPGDGVQ